MSSDLIFPILPREGKVPIVHDDETVQRVEKEAKLRALNDEEKELHAEEKEVREKYQQKNKEGKKHQQQRQQNENQKTASKEESGDVVTEDEHGRKHLDIYV